MASQQGAYLNAYHVQMAAMVFRINAWTYYKQNPRELAKQIEEQEQSMNEKGGGVSTEQRVVM